MTLIHSALASAIFALGQVSAAPIASVDETNMVRYAVTQGGLLAVVLILLYFKRQDDQQLRQETENKHQENLEKMNLLTAIAERTATAGEQAAASGRENAAAINRLASSVERFEKLPPANCTNFLRKD